MSCFCAEFLTETCLEVWVNKICKWILDEGASPNSNERKKPEAKHWWAWDDSIYKQSQMGSTQHKGWAQKGALVCDLVLGCKNVGVRCTTINLIIYVSSVKTLIKDQCLKNKVIIIFIQNALIRLAVFQTVPAVVSTNSHWWININWDKNLN